MRRLFALGVAVTVLGLTAQTASARDYDCSDFPTQRKAQKFFKKHGGPKRDPHRLDGDNDGFACEALP